MSLKVGPYSINKGLSDVIDQPSQNSQVFGISRDADVSALSCETLTPFILADFLFNYCFPVGAGWVVKQKNQHYSNYWLTMK